MVWSGVQLLIFKEFPLVRKMNNM